MLDDLAGLLATLAGALTGFTERALQQFCLPPVAQLQSPPPTELADEVVARQEDGEVVAAPSAAAEENAAVEVVAPPRAARHGDAATEAEVAVPEENEAAAAGLAPDESTMERRDKR